MLTIIIIGAGRIGCYVAQILSQEQHNVVLVDKDEQKLNDVTRELDVATRHGSGSDWELLDDLLELNPALLIAMTADDETNLVSCSIAKKLGYPRTIARVRDGHFLNRMRLDFGHIFDVDYFISPELLVANEMLEYMTSPGSLLVESFAHGAVQLRTLEIPQRWQHGKEPLSRLPLPPGIIVGLIRRGAKSGPATSASRPEQTLIFPHGNDTIMPGDEVTIIGETAHVSEIHHFFGITPQTVRSLVIVGGSLVCVNLARLLEQRDIEIRIIEKDYLRCSQLADLLPHCTILHHDATDLDFLKSERIEDSELLVACTNHDEINMLCAMLGKEAGCRNAMITLSNTTYTSMLEKMAIDYAVSPQILAVDHITAQLFSGTITSLVSLYDNLAEIVEVNISMNSKIVGIPLSELGPLLPRDLLIAIIQNRGRIMIANGGRIISPADSVILIASPARVSQLSTIF